MSQIIVIAVEPGTVDDASVVVPVLAREKRRCCWRPIPITLVLSLMALTAYATYQRLGTTANADSVEYTRNLAGGFLAVGMTQDQPGFMVLSALDREKVDVNATQAVNRVAGTHTVVEVRTAHDTKRVRLRSPVLIVVSEDGAIERHHVIWTVAEFNALREAADCSHEAAVKKRRCGAPFTDLQEAFAKWSGDRVPKGVHAFLAPFKDHRTHD